LKIILLVYPHVSILCAAMEHANKEANSGPYCGV